MHSELKTIRDIKKKLEENNAIITKADKGNSIVIIQNDSYQEKIRQFIQNNEFIVLDKNYTKKYQKEIRTALNTCRTVIQKAAKCKLISLNPSPPTIRGLIKIRKNNTPIRPIKKLDTSSGIQNIKETSKNL